ncbi:glutathione S-transferase family protein [Aquabacterium sp. J223]|uniref:glutathione S-transferase family protein n=1 Tax=Aquabacterium sp. J223 TaxID=2898431 RepID=UPI0021ADA1F7|nr:glutathione S-transferase [Aquabacterium sp. J223]UUX95166.1 glutathione S-transferase [Aquabacterium sp. J223]
MIVVHHLERSRSQRVLWLLEELGLPYELKTYRRDPKTMLAPPELRAVHPLGKSPVITDDGLTLSESGAILEYLADRYADPAWRPPLSTEAGRRCNHWLHFAEGSAMPPLLMTLVFDTVERRAPFLVRPIAKRIAAQVKAGFIQPNIRRHLDHMEAALASSDWFAGDAPTIADVQMSFVVEASAVRSGFDRHPRLRAYLERMRARPAYRRAVEKGGPVVFG